MIKEKLYDLETCLTGKQARGGTPLIIDITQEFFSGKVYPGDKKPKLTVRKTFERDGFRLSEFECCAHNGTHIDAPAHFIENGRFADELPLEKCCGKCFVADCVSDAADAAKKYKKVLLRGCVLTAADAPLFTGLDLIGVENQSVSGSGDTEKVHKLLLGSGVVILEGLDLSKADSGEYTLIALPLKLGGADGSPVRAVLIPMYNVQLTMHN